MVTFTSVWSFSEQWTFLSSLSWRRRRCNNFLDGRRLLHSCRVKMAWENSWNNSLWSRMLHFRLGNVPNLNREYYWWRAFVKATIFCFKLFNAAGRALPPSPQGHTARPVSKLLGRRGESNWKPPVNSRRSRWVVPIQQFQSMFRRW